MKRLWKRCLVALAFALFAGGIAAAESATKITFALHVANVKDQEPAAYAIVQEFMKKNPDIIVEIQGTETNEHIKKMKMASQANMLPDIFWLLPAPAKEMAAAGNLLDLTDFINKDLASGFKKNMLNVMNVNGKLYGLPYQGLVTGFWYNQALFDKYNLKVPQTYEQLLKCTMIFKKNGVITFAKGSKDPFGCWAYMTMLARYGYFEKIDDIIAGKKSFVNDDFRKFYQKIDELRVAGAFPENVATLNYYQAMDLFLNGKAAFMDSGIWESGKIEKSALRKVVGFWAGPEFADGVGNQKIMSFVPHAPVCVSANVAKDAKKLAAVQRFFKFYFGPEGAKIMNQALTVSSQTFTGKLDKVNHPAFSKALEVINNPAYTSIPIQPDNVATEAFGNALYDSIFGVTNGVYTPDEAMEVVQREVPRR